MVEDVQGNALTSQEFDLIIIGGGITGAGLFREAAGLGWKVLLLESKDFASGTSSRSTKLIHGGIRYLQNGQWQLVAEGARERKKIAREAPHLAQPIDLLLTASNLFQACKYWLGVSLYEWLGQVAKADRHRLLWGAQLRALEPELNQEKFPYGIVYREYLTDDARLVLANIRAGLAAGGIACNYTPVVGLHHDEKRLVGVQVDSGGVLSTIKAERIVNAAGPWVTDILAMDSPSDRQLILSKGVHLVVSRASLPLTQSCMLVADDGRPIFVIPSDETVYVGTTDSLCEGTDRYGPTVDRKDVDYLLKVVNHYFKSSLSEAQIIGSWAGVRPLISEGFNTAKSDVKTEIKAVTKRTPEYSAPLKTSEISRKDEVWLSPNGLLTIAGGKLTGYLKMSERVIAAICKQSPRLSLSRAVPESILPGARSGKTRDQVLADLQGSMNVEPMALKRLAQRYGDEAPRVIGLGETVIAPGIPIFKGEVIWALEQEYAKTLEDVIYRRLRLPLYHPLIAEQSCEPLSQLMASRLRWDEPKRIEQVEVTLKQLKADLMFGDPVS